jgi:D-alanyl-lipoteichoic acid acyltransferase DltB (MBOAT superfamily)
MLFNSYEFIFLFLPVTFAGYFFIHHKGWHQGAFLWLLGASCFFYAYWNPVYLLLFASSVLANYFFGQLLASQKWHKLPLLVGGITANLLALAYFKYADFFILNVNTVTGSSYDFLHLLLPLGISFFTFNQIAYLVDIYHKQAPRGSLTLYGLFVSFFPHLIAGPIVHHKEMMPQFALPDSWKINYRNVCLGLLIFIAGLFKKVVIADSLAPWANAGFDATHTLTFFEAWISTLAYTFQIYYDFSGYSAMAIGLGLLFNIQFPQNFNAPYKALNIQDFWRRWHMTLSRFLREYVYIPLGGNRFGSFRTFFNGFLVFAVAGLWHGASWTFVVWGVLHGLAVGFFGLWKKIGIPLPKAVSWTLTFLFVVVTWIFFRSPSLEKSLSMVRSLLGLEGVSLPVALNGMIALPGVSFEGIFTWAGLGTFVVPVALLCVAGAYAFLGSTISQISERFTPNVKWFAGMIVVFLMCLYFMNTVSEFLYYNF